SRHEGREIPPCRDIHLPCRQDGNHLRSKGRAHPRLSLLWSLISFKQSFRVGIDTDRPDKLIVDGIFAFSRNPIYLAFAMVLIGEFLIFPNWITLIYLVAATWLVHRQVLREEKYLKGHYGRAYEQYCHRVRRYL